jgi:CubicO group peptidase (beta-lactamase class C family)
MPAALTRLAALACAALSLAGCATPAPTPAAPAAASSTEPRALAVDTPLTTPAGNTFIAPAGWSVTVRGDTMLLAAPEGGSFIALTDVRAASAEAAVAAAWAAYARDGKPTPPWPLRVVTPLAPRDSWTDRRAFDYQTSPVEHRVVSADVRRANDLWTVAIVDMAADVREKRAAQVGQVFGKLLPKGYVRESFAGKRAHPLDAARVAALTQFIERAMRQTRVPGVSLGLIENGKVVFAGGFGVRELGRPATVDADTRYLIASNTKAMATLMLARLVDDGRLAWDAPAAKVYPAFRLGNADTTARVQVKHLICACTGMPRRDMEWLLEYGAMTPTSALALMGSMQPTSGFGELFQYSNPMAAAAGYIGGQVLFPGTEPGAAYDRAMDQLVFEPLGMRSTTHDFARAQQGNAAVPHAPDIDGTVRVADGRVNLSVVPVRPAGGAWSSVNDVLKYVAMELAEGRLPNGERYISREALLARRAAQVSVGTDVSYGMGLFVNTVYGTTVVHHGGDMIGFHSDMMWLPEHGVGAVVLTNGDPGWLIRSVFRRKLLEVLFDGRPEADATLEVQAQSFFAELAADRKLLKLLADPTVTAALASRYTNPQIGGVTVQKSVGDLRFDFGEWASEMASRANPDGSTSVMTTAPGMIGFEFLPGRKDGKRTLTLRDAQHEYVMVEAE